MKKCIAECIGTFGLVFCGTGAIVINELSSGVITHVGVAITFGLIVMAMIYTFGDRSGAHFNPAVTIAFVLYKVFPAKDLLPYILSQLIGAILASLLLKILFPSSEFLGATIPSGSWQQSFVLEIILSFFLMLTILNVTSSGKEKGLFAGLAIGSVVLLGAMFAGPVSGASMNPARSLGPSIISGKLNFAWLYIFAPITGAIAATLIHKLIK